MPSKFLILSLISVTLLFSVVSFATYPTTKPIKESSVAVTLPLVSPIVSAAPTVSPEPTPQPSTQISSELSLDRIFSDDHSSAQAIPADRRRTVIATGDVLTARSVNSKIVAANDFTRVFAKTADTLKKADLTLINLETPLIANCPLTNEGMLFCGDTRNVQGLVFAGVDIASLANNHAGNHGLAGTQETAKVLTEAGISPIGTTESGPVYKEIRGVTFAFLGYNDIGSQAGVAAADHDRVVGQIQEAKTKADIVIVMFHWGVEYTTQPTDRQRELARLAIDSGADIIVSNHPHWIQPLEFYKGKPIAYALGNFIFDQTWSTKTQEGVVAQFTFDDKKLADIEFLPVSISSSGQSDFMTGSKKRKILDEMKAASLELNRRP